MDYFTSGMLGLAFGSLNTGKYSCHSSFSACFCPRGGPNVAFSITASPVQQLTYFKTILPTLHEPLFTVNLKHRALGNYSFG